MKLLTCCIAVGGIDLCSSSSAQAQFVETKDCLK